MPEFMKRVNEYRKLFSVDETTDLAKLKTTYRNLVKEWHPDKFAAGDPMAAEAELKSRQVIDAYHFLVSIAPETTLANLDEYASTTLSGIADLKHKGLLLEITFIDGNTYEFFGVTGAVYHKMINADNLNRFAKRNIYNTYLYRKSKKELQVA